MAGESDRMESVSLNSIVSSHRPWLHLISANEFTRIGRTVNSLDLQTVHRLSGVEMRTLDELFHVD